MERDRPRKSECLVGVLGGLPGSSVEKGRSARKGRQAAAKTAKLEMIIARGAGHEGVIGPKGSSWRKRQIATARHPLSRQKSQWMAHFSVQVLYVLILAYLLRTMKFSIFSLAPLVFTALLLQATPIVAAEEDHAHEDEHGHEAEKCACMAEEMGFAMDCSDTAAMMEALMVLKSSGCNTDCSSPECEKNWYIVQAHHDYCDESAMPNEIEDDFHDYDEVCES